MKSSYTEVEFKELVSRNKKRSGWNFSSMRTISYPKWDYLEIVKDYLKVTDKVLDIGTGGGERFTELSKHFRKGVGIDIDLEMIKENSAKYSAIPNLQFVILDESLKGLDNDFNVILNRHAPFNLKSIKNHLVPGGLFITQQVGEKNMLNVMKILNTPISLPPIDEVMISSNNMKTIRIEKYDIKYVVRDVESLIFWLAALDKNHSAIDGPSVLKNVDIFNELLQDNVTEEGFVTNEERYLAIATS